jgi:hypothetical protein
MRSNHVRERKIDKLANGEETSKELKTLALRYAYFTGFWIPLILGTVEIMGGLILMLGYGWAAF